MHIVCPGLWGFPTILMTSSLINTIMICQSSVPHYGLYFLPFFCFLGNRFSFIILFYFQKHHKKLPLSALSSTVIVMLTHANEKH